MSYAQKIEELITCSMDEILRRYEADTNYSLINTKLDLLTGKDFSAQDPWYKQKDIIFCWIQGRGIEALARHIRYFAQKNDTGRVERLTKFLVAVTDSMEFVRLRNHNRLFFMMNLRGDKLTLDANGNPQKNTELCPTANYSDLFYTKGLLASACLQKSKKLLPRARKWLDVTIADIKNETFKTDQQMFDPANPVTYIYGKQLQGPKMIALSATALGMEVDTDNRDHWERSGKALLKILFEKYLALEDKGELKQYDFWEAVDKDGVPWEDNGKIICDPGHGLEFVGLSLKNLLSFKTPSGIKLANKCRKFYADLLVHLFEIGFAPGPQGIIKSFDLRSRKPVNTDMPWWSLPETIRAAALCYEFTGDERCCDIMKKCLDAFFNCYVRYDLHHMAVQTRNSRGEAVAVIPATPDADPGYHTNLSLIDALPVIRKLNM